MERVFTPIEANRTLPLVRSIVNDILACGRELRARSTEESGHGAVRELRDRLRDLIAELKRIGCEYKDWGFELGLVDFPAEIDGQKVLLCWRSDEPEVAHYHGELDGYPGRRTIPGVLDGSAPTRCTASGCAHETPAQSHPNSTPPSDQATRPAESPPTPELNAENSST